MLKDILRCPWMFSWFSAPSWTRTTGGPRLGVLWAKPWPLTDVGLPGGAVWGAKGAALHGPVRVVGTASLLELIRWSPLRLCVREPRPNEVRDVVRCWWNRIWSLGGSLLNHSSTRTEMNTAHSGFFLPYWKKTWHCRARKFIKHWNMCYCFDTISSLGIILEKK